MDQSEAKQAAPEPETAEQEQKRLELMRTVCSSHRTFGSALVPDRDAQHPEEREINQAL